MVFIYVLELEKNKFYIGTTIYPDFRFLTHFNPNGSEWTKKYKPKKVIELIPDCNDLDEDKYTLKYMEKYGINNVRGGSFCEIKLNDNNLITLKQIINNITDKCYICGNTDHYANNCKKKEEKISTININETCNCISSYLFTHKISKCLLNNIFTYFDEEDGNEEINKLLKLQEIEFINLLQKMEEGKDYAIEEDNQLHEMEEGTKIKLYYCNNCNKEFDTLKGITYHKNIYCKTITNKNVYWCSYCNKSFNTLNSVNYHKNKHIIDKYGYYKWKTDFHAIKLG